MASDSVKLSRSMDILPQTTLARISTDIRLTRMLPQRGEVTVQNGQQVTPTQIIARSHRAAKYYILDAKAEFGLDPEELDEQLLVDLGTPLEEGAPLIRRSQKSDKAEPYPCPVDGKLVELFESSLIIQVPDKVIELRAMVHGKISRIIPQEGVEIHVVGSQVQAVWDSGREGGGRLLVSTESPTDELVLENIKTEMGRSIVVAGRLASHQVLEVLENYQTRGLVVGSIRAELIPKAREVMFPIFVTDGIGEQSMSDAFFGIFQQASGKESSLIRGSEEDGEQRSSIIIPEPGSQLVKAGDAGWNLLKSGDYVRVILSSDNIPGKVISVNPEASQTVTGGWMPGADIELNSGEVVFVPYTNIDVLN